MARGNTLHTAGTLLLTDIVKSVAAREKSGTPATAAMKGRHHAIVKAAVGGGWIVKTAGDAYFVLFKNAHAAVRAGLLIQIGHAFEPWGEKALEVSMTAFMGEFILTNRLGHEYKLSTQVQVVPDEK